MKGSRSGTRRSALEGQTAIITGATSGIGAATAREFVAQGARVVAVGRNEHRGESLVHALGQNRCVFVGGNVQDVETGKAAVRATEAWGGPDILINNAGVDHTAPLLEASYDDVFFTMSVNFFGVLNMMQAVGASMSKRSGGSIVNVTSRLASIGVPTMGCYGATKGAVEALTRHAAVEWADIGIRVNSVAPGFTRTAIYDDWIAADPAVRKASAVRGIPQGRIGEVDEIAAAIAFLASPSASHITGATLPVDGGYTAA